MLLSPKMALLTWQAREAMAWALLGLEGLTELRDRIPARQTTSHQAVTAFSQLIGGLLELIVEVADAALLPATLERVFS